MTRETFMYACGHCGVLTIWPSRRTKDAGTDYEFCDVCGTHALMVPVSIDFERRQFIAGTGERVE